MTLSHAPSTNPKRNRLVEGSGDLSGLSALVQDTTGDGYGDLAGVTKRLPYIASLGVDAIWLSPFFTSPMADMGYDVSDYCNVDPLFGNACRFRRADGRGASPRLKSHHRSGDFAHVGPASLVCGQPGEPDKQQGRLVCLGQPQAGRHGTDKLAFSIGGPAWEWDGVRKQYYMHSFLASQPDLNFHNPEVQMRC